MCYKVWIYGCVSLLTVFLPHFSLLPFWQIPEQNDEKLWVLTPVVLVQVHTLQASMLPSSSLLIMMKASNQSPLPTLSFLHLLESSLALSEKLHYMTDKSFQSISLYVSTFELNFGWKSSSYLHRCNAYNTECNRWKEIRGVGFNWPTFPLKFQINNNRNAISPIYCCIKKIHLLTGIRIIIMISQFLVLTKHSRMILTRLSKIPYWSQLKTFSFTCVGHGLGWLEKWEALSLSTWSRTSS